MVFKMASHGVEAGLNQEGYSIGSHSVVHVWGIGQRVEWSAQAREGRKGGRGRGGRGRERFLRLLYLSTLNSWWPVLRGTGPPSMGLWSTYSCAHARVCACVSRDSPPVCEACCVLPLQIYIGAALPELAFKPDSIYIPALEGGWEGVGGVVQCVGLWVRASL